MKMFWEYALIHVQIVHTTATVRQTDIEIKGQPCKQRRDKETDRQTFIHLCKYLLSIDIM